MKYLKGPQGMRDVATTKRSLIATVDAVLRGEASGTVGS